MNKHNSAIAPETRDFSLKPVSPENLAEALRQEVAAMMGIGADKITVKAYDGQIRIEYDAGVVEMIRMEASYDLP